MPGSGKELADALRQLMTASVAFEKKAARHARIEAERRDLLDAITRAQLQLSVKPEAAPANPEAWPPREPSPHPALRSIPGGRRASKEPTKGTRSKTPARNRKSKSPA
jgi:hypothetical protein